MATIANLQLVIYKIFYGWCNSKFVTVVTFDCTGDTFMGMRIPPKARRFQVSNNLFFIF